MAGPNERYRVPIKTESLHHFGDSLGHAIDFGWISLGDNGQPQTPLRGAMIGWHQLLNSMNDTHLGNLLWGSYGLKSQQ